MKVYIDRYTIRIIPEDERDVAFIEDTMRLSKDGDEISLERIDNDNDPQQRLIIPTVNDEIESITLETAEQEKKQLI